tara:strand:- start:9782 stop:10474 length:693 start_codon:yes stop_codon:yes gene_type:complete
MELEPLRQSLARLPDPLRPAAWPAASHDIPESRCHWFSEQGQEGYAKVLKNLPLCPLYLELGTFLGAGSTAFALETREDLQAICLDNWEIATVSGEHKPFNYSDKDGNPCGFVRGEGSALEHCQNNLRQYRSRVHLLKAQISHVTIDILANAGIRPDCVFIDDDHGKEPLVKRLFRCRYRWPGALIVCDDYCKMWPGVIEGVAEAFKRGWYREDESQMLGNRMIAFKGKR